MKNKFTRICWNTEDWRFPTGNAATLETSGTYAATHGFGHEEWLFNFEWIIDGYRYGYLQPISKYYGRYSGGHCSILLYTFTREREYLLIGRIDNSYVPYVDELNRVLEISAENGWIQEMISDVERIGGNSAELDNPEATAISNIRFRPEDVQIFDPRPRVVGNHVIANQRRYHPFDWVDNYPETEIQPPRSEPTDPRRSEHERTRAAQEASKYDPRHVRLQNQLYEYLCGVHGHKNVQYEHNYVDLVICEPDGDIFFEIKLETTAKKCIRVALGQLLEYAYFPDLCLAKRLVIVGNAPASESDRTYLAELRRRFQVPVYYSRFSSENNELTTEV